MVKGLTISQFRKKFPDNAACMSYLLEQKWQNGYTCRRCGCTENGKGRLWYYKRCKSCRFDESATAHTLFEGVKLQLRIVFEIAYRVSLRKKGMSTCELAKEVGCQQKNGLAVEGEIPICHGSMQRR